MNEDMKVVQTSLSREEYKALREALAKKGMSIKEGLREAAINVISQELKLDSGDPFLSRKSSKGSGLGDLSDKHDKHLYVKKK